MNKTKNLTFTSAKFLHTINLNVHFHSENPADGTVFLWCRREQKEL